MVKVHIWLPDDGHVGHTALTIRGVYFSFWPEERAGLKDLKIKRSHPGSYMEELLDDIRNEGGRQPVTIELHGLDEDRMLEYVERLMLDVPRYQLAWNNCSTMVVNCLVEGSGRPPGFVPHAGHYSRLGRILGIGIWTPHQVLRFVRELQNS